MSQDFMCPNCGTIYSTLEGALDCCFEQNCTSARATNLAVDDIPVDISYLTVRKIDKEGRTQ